MEDPYETFGLSFIYLSDWTQF